MHVIHKVHFQIFTIFPSSAGKATSKDWDACDCAHCRGSILGSTFEAKSSAGRGRLDQKVRELRGHTIPCWKSQTSSTRRCPESRLLTLRANYLVSVMLAGLDVTYGPFRFDKSQTQVVRLPLKALEDFDKVRVILEQEVGSWHVESIGLQKGVMYRILFVGS